MKKKGKKVNNESIHGKSSLREFYVEEICPSNLIQDLPYSIRNLCFTSYSILYFSECPRIIISVLLLKDAILLNLLPGPFIYLFKESETS